MHRPSNLILAAAYLASASLALAASRSLSNSQIEAQWNFGDKGTADGSLSETGANETLALKGDLFSIVMADGTILSSRRK